MSFNYQLGMNAKLYVTSEIFTAANAAAVESADTTELSNATNVSLNLETGESDTTTRANNGWRSTAPTLKDGSIEFEMLAKSPDPNLTAVKTAWLSSTEIGLIALTGPLEEAGHEGPAGNYTVTNFSRDESLEEAIKYNVTLKPSSHMQWYETSSSSE